jgi:hypothetical protein
MDLLQKVRVLVGALVHKPFTSKPDRIDLEEDAEPVQEQAVPRNSSTLEAAGTKLPDQERVADLIVEQQRDRAD